MSTVRVRMLKQAVTVLPSGHPMEFIPGAVVEWPAFDAERAIRNGICEAVPEPAPESAAKKGRP